MTSWERRSQSVASSNTHPPQIPTAAVQSGMMDRLRQWWTGTPKADETPPLNRDNLTLQLPTDARMGSMSSGIPTPVRTPVDEFNESMLEELYRQRNLSGRFGENEILRRRRDWTQVIAGTRGAQSQDCVKAIGNDECMQETVKDELTNFRLSRETRDSLSATWPMCGLHMNRKFFKNFQHFQVFFALFFEKFSTHVILDRVRRRGLNPRKGFNPPPPLPLATPQGLF